MRSAYDRAAADPLAAWRRSRPGERSKSRGRQTARRKGRIHLPGRRRRRSKRIAHQALEAHPLQLEKDHSKPAPSTFSFALPSICLPLACPVSVFSGPKRATTEGYRPSSTHIMQSSAAQRCARQRRAVSFFLSLARSHSAAHHSCVRKCIAIFIVPLASSDILSPTSDGKEETAIVKHQAADCVWLLCALASIYWYSSRKSIDTTVRQSLRVRQ